MISKVRNFQDEIKDANQKNEHIISSLSLESSVSQLKQQQYFLPLSSSQNHNTNQLQSLYNNLYHQYQQKESEFDELQRIYKQEKQAKELLLQENQHLLAYISENGVNFTGGSGGEQGQGQLKEKYNRMGGMLVRQREINKELVRIVEECVERLQQLKDNQTKTSEDKQMISSIRQFLQFVTKDMQQNSFQFFHHLIYQQQQLPDQPTIMEQTTTHNKNSINSKVNGQKQQSSNFRVKIRDLRTQSNCRYLMSEEKQSKVVENNSNENNNGQSRLQMQQLQRKIYISDYLEHITQRSKEQTQRQMEEDNASDDYYSSRHHNSENNLNIWGASSTVQRYNMTKSDEVKVQQMTQSLHDMTRKKPLLQQVEMNNDNAQSNSNNSNHCITTNQSKPKISHQQLYSTLLSIEKKFTQLQSSSNEQLQRTKRQKQLLTLENAQLQDTIIRLREQILDMDSEIKIKTQKNNALTKEKNQLLEEKNGLLDGREKLLLQNDNLVKEVERLNDDMTVCIEEIARLNELIKTLGQQISQAKSSPQRLISDNTKQQMTKQEQSKQLQHPTAKLTQQNKLLTAKIDCWRQVAKENQSKTNLLQRQIYQLKQQLEKYNQMVKQFQQQKTKIEKNNILEQQHAAVIKERSVLEERLAQMEQIILHDKQTLLDMEEESIKTKQKLIHMEEQRNQINKQNAQLTSRLKNFEKEVVLGSKRQDELKAQLQKMNRQLQNVRDTMKRVSKQKQRRQTSRNRTMILSRKSSLAMVESSQQLQQTKKSQELKTAATHYGMIIAQKDINIKQLNETVMRLKERLEEIERMFTNEKLLKAKMEEKIAELQKIQAELMEEKRRYEAKAGELQNEKKEMHLRLQDDYKQRINKLQSTHAADLTQIQQQYTTKLSQLSLGHNQQKTLLQSTHINNLLQQQLLHSKQLQQLNQHSLQQLQKQSQTLTIQLENSEKQKEALVIELAVYKEEKQAQVKQLGEIISGKIMELQEKMIEEESQYHEEVERLVGIVEMKEQEIKSLNMRQQQQQQQQIYSESQHIVEQQLQEQINKLEQQKKECENKLVVLKNELQQWINRTNQLEGLLLDKERHLLSLSNVLHTKERDILSLSQRLQKQQHELHKLSNTLESKSTQIQSLNNALSFKQKDLQQLSSTNKTLQTKLILLNATVEELRGQMRKNQEKNIYECEEKIKSMKKAAMEEMLKKQQQIQQIESFYVRQIEDMESHFAAYQHQKDNQLKAIQQQHNSLLAEYQTSLTQHKTILEQLNQTHLKKLSQATLQSQQTTNIMKELNKKARDKLMSQEQKIKQLEYNLKEYSQLMDEKDAGLRELVERLREKEEELEELRRQESRLNESEQNMESKFGELETELNRKIELLQKQLLMNEQKQFTKSSQLTKIIQTISTQRTFLKAQNEHLIKALEREAKLTKQKLRYIGVQMRKQKLKLHALTVSCRMDAIERSNKNDVSRVSQKKGYVLGMQEKQQQRLLPQQHQPQPQFLMIPITQQQPRSAQMINMINNKRSLQSQKDIQRQKQQQRKIKTQSQKFNNPFITTPSQNQNYYHFRQKQLLSDDDYGDEVSFDPILMPMEIRNVNVNIKNNLISGNNNGNGVINSISGMMKNRPMSSFTPKYDNYSITNQQNKAKTSNSSFNSEFQVNFVNFNTGNQFLTDRFAKHQDIFMINNFENYLQEHSQPITRKIHHEQQNKQIKNLELKILQASIQRKREEKQDLMRSIKEREQRNH